MANISKHRIHNLNKWHILNKVLHKSEPCMVVLSGLEAFCRHHGSISHKTENVIQVNNKQDISTDISNVFTLASSWVLTATGFCNKCVLQQYGFIDSFSSRGPFQRVHGLFVLICLLACSSSWRAVRKDFTSSLMKKTEWVLMCLWSTQIFKLSPDVPHPGPNTQRRTLLHKNSWRYKLQEDWDKLKFNTHHTNKLLSNLVPS